MTLWTPGQDEPEPTPEGSEPNTEEAASETTEYSTYAIDRPEFVVKGPPLSVEDLVPDELIRAMIKRHALSERVIFWRSCGEIALPSGDVDPATNQQIFTSYPTQTLWIGMRNRTLKPAHPYQGFVWFFIKDVFPFDPVQLETSIAAAIEYCKTEKAKGLDGFSKRIPGTRP